MRLRGRPFGTVLVPPAPSTYTPKTGTFAAIAIAISFDTPPALFMLRPTKTMHILVAAIFFSISASHVPAGSALFEDQS